MKLIIDYNNPCISSDKAMQITTADLDNFYSSASEQDKTNLFFVLLSSLHKSEEEKATEQAAHLCFLTAYYLFNPLTPPASQPLAKHYIEKAVIYNNCSQYREFSALIENGN